MDRGWAAARGGDRSELGYARGADRHPCGHPAAALGSFARGEEMPAVGARRLSRSWPVTPTTTPPRVASVACPRSS